MQTCNICPNGLLLFQYKSVGCQRFLEPGGDVLKFEGRGDLGAAQAEYPAGVDQHQKQMGKRALGSK